SLDLARRAAATNFLAGLAPTPLNRAHADAAAVTTPQRNVACAVNEKSDTCSGPTGSRSQASPGRSRGRRERHRGGHEHCRDKNPFHDAPQASANTQNVDF